MKKQNFLLRLLLEWVLVWIGVLSAVYCTTTAFNFPMPAAVRILVPVLALIFCLLFQGQGKLGKYYALGTLGLFVLLGWLFWEELWTGLRGLWGTIFHLFGQAYNELSFLDPKDPTIEVGSICLGLTIMAVLETWICAMAVRLWKRTTPYGIALMLSIAPCFGLTDTPPALFPLMAAVFAVLTLAFSQSARRRDAGEHNKAVALSALLAAALLGCLLLLFPKESHTPPITWQDLSDKMARWEERQNNQGNVNAGLSGVPDQIDLSALGALPNRSVLALHATSTEDIYAYLRGSSYAGFDGRYWSRGKLWDGGNDALFPCLGSSGTASLNVETLRAEPVLYTTYQVTRLPNTGQVFSDAYIENTAGVTRYDMDFVQDPGMTNPDPSYDAWVRENCLEVPDRTREGVLAWWSTQPDAAFAFVPGSDGEIRGDSAVFFSDYSGSAATEKLLLNFAREVAVRVSRSASYSRNPVRVPEGEDFCTWFLNEAEEGYCVHYATACTALLRSLGIPARYVSGYVSSLKANERTAVTVLQAHAWVEVWIGGCWTVVDPTPDNATEFTGNIAPDGDQPVNTTEATAPQQSETPTLPPPITKHTAPSADTKEAETTDPKTSESRGGSDGKPNSQNPEERDLTLLWDFLGIVGFVTLVTGRRILILRLRERRLRRARPNDRARLLCRYILRLCRLAGSKVPPEVTALGQKASFSQYELDDTELFFLRQIYEQQQNRLRISGFWKRKWYKFVLAVI